MVETMIKRADGVTIVRIGDVGITLTGTREDGSYLDAKFEVGADMPTDELIALVGTFLAFIDEKFGRKTAFGMIAHYADEKKLSRRAGERDLFSLSWTPFH